MPVFQLERISGLRGGLFGGVSDPATASWDLLDRFPSADLIGFTTYPGLVHQDPDQIPGDYYRSLADRVDRPIAFIEVGWHAAPGPAGFESSPEEQRRFVERFFTLTEGLPLEVAVWLHLYDQPGMPAPFDTMGLFDREGDPRPAWEAWADNVAP